MPIGPSIVDNFVTKAADLVSSFLRREKLDPETAQNQTQTAEPDAPESHPSEPSAFDKLALSSQISGAVQSQTLEGTPQDVSSPNEAAAHAIATGKSGEAAAGEIADSDLVEDGSDKTNAPSSFDGELAESGERSPELGNLLHTWMQADPKTLNGLKNFLQVQFSHYDEDPETFKTFQLISMLREAREMLEQQKLADVATPTQNVSTSDAAERALLAASLTGMAYYALRQKNIKTKKAGQASESQAILDLETSELASCLEEVLDYLKKAEAGLERAMTQGANHRKFRLLIHKVLDVCADVLEMQRELSQSH